MTSLTCMFLCLYVYPVCTELLTYAFIWARVNVVFIICVTKPFWYLLDITLCDISVISEPGLVLCRLPCWLFKCTCLMEGFSHSCLCLHSSNFGMYNQIVLTKVSWWEDRTSFWEKETNCVWYAMHQSRGIFSQWQLRLHYLNKLTRQISATTTKSSI